MKMPQIIARRAVVVSALVALAWPLHIRCAADEGAADADAKTTPESPWKSLLEGNSLQNWQPTQFGGEGGVSAKDGVVVLEQGAPMTGITWNGGEFPKSNYELRFEARRVLGTDFFCGVTFPVQDRYCSLIGGGWGGTVVGLSSIDGEDASENSTRQSRVFRKGQWYTFRIQVTDAQIRAWIDDEQIIDQPLEGRNISIRPEVSLSRPLGFCTFETQAELRQIVWRPLATQP